MIGFTGVFHFMSIVNRCCNGTKT
ncbi:hypothetical protein YPPY48_2063, partial [Yersinia pestis PY-48]